MASSEHKIILKLLPHCRWLDVEALVHLLCKENDPQSDIVGIKYFTAPIKAGLSPRGIDSVKAQSDYLRALEKPSSSLEIINGKYFIVPGNYYENSKPIDFTKKHKVLRPEEKQTDVNIALHMLSDAIDQRCQQQVLFSNDSDYAPILSMIKERDPTIRLGVVPPILSDKVARYPSTELAHLSDWSRKSIEESLLNRCQLPPKVPTRKRPILKPEHWN